MKQQMRVYYDEEGDFLEIMFGESKEDYGEHVSEDIVLFKSEKTEEIIGIGIFNFKKRSKNLKNIKLNLPVKVSLDSLNQIS